MLSIGILTYNSPITLYNSLLSYKISGLFDYTDDIIVVIQPSNKFDEEENICKSFNINKIFKNNENTMMSGGINLIQEEAKYKYVLFLECDFRICYNKTKLFNLLDYSIKLLEEEKVNIVRLRSLKNPGHQIQHNLYKKSIENTNYENVETLNDDLLSQLYLVTHYIENPEIIFRDYITEINKFPLTYKMSSKNCCYTNNPHIISKDFYNNNIKKYTCNGKTLESEIDMDWSSQYDHKIAITEGCFTHIRMDGHNNCTCCPIISGGISNICGWKCCENEIKCPKIFEETDLL